MMSAPVKPKHPPLGLIQKITLRLRRLAKSYEDAEYRMTFRGFYPGSKEVMKYTERREFLNEIIRELEDDSRYEDEVDAERFAASRGRYE